MIVELLSTLGAWSWWVLGLLLLGVEVFLPGFFFLWFGIAALIIGTSALLFTWPWQFQIVGFAVVSVIAALVGRRFGGVADKPSADPHLNLRGERLVGRSFILEEPIVEGVGRVRVDDSIWQVRGPDAPAGSRVIVVSGDGPLLRVIPG